MALFKHFEDNYGDGGYEYWKIIEININWLNKSSHIVLAGYINKDARDAGKLPMDTRPFDWIGDDFPFIENEPQNERQEAYDKIKGTEEFSDATDI